MILEMVRLALDSVRAHKMRSLLNLLGIIIAVGTIIAVISVVSGLNQFASRLINQLGPNTFIVAKIGLVTSREAFIEANKRPDFTMVDVEAVRRLVPDALRVTGRIFSTRAVYAEGSRLPDTFVLGTGPEFPWMVGMELDDGRYFTETENAAARPVAVIGWDVKDELFPHVDPVGRMLKIDGKPYRVVGMLVRQGRLLGQSQDKVVLIPITSYQKAYGKNRSIDIFVEAPYAGTMPDVMDDARVAIRARRGTRFDARDPFDIVTAETLQEFWQNFTFAAFALVIWIASISLVVGGVAVANTMFASVVERTHEIGVRKAVGARRRDVRRQFLFESLGLTLVGGAVGVGLGWLVAIAVAAFSPFPALVTPGLVIAGMTVAAVAGLVAGLLPAIRASRLDPVEALRAE